MSKKDNIYSGAQFFTKMVYIGFDGKSKEIKFEIGFSRLDCSGMVKFVTRVILLFYFVYAIFI